MFAKRSRQDAESMCRVIQAIDWLDEQSFAEDVDANAMSEAVRCVQVVVSEGVESVSWRARAELHFFLLQAVFKKAVRLYPKTLLSRLLHQVDDQGYPSEDDSLSDLDAFDPDKHVACLCVPSYLDGLSSGQVGEKSNVAHFPHAAIVWWTDPSPAATSDFK